MPPRRLPPARRLPPTVPNCSAPCLLRCCASSALGSARCVTACPATSADCGGGVRPRRAGPHLRDHGAAGAEGGQEDRPAHLLRRLPGGAGRQPSSRGPVTRMRASWWWLLHRRSCHHRRQRSATSTERPSLARCSPLRLTYPVNPILPAGCAQHGRPGVHGLPPQVPPHRHLLQVLLWPGQAALPHALQ